MTGSGLRLLEGEGTQRTTGCHLDPVDRPDDWGARLRKGNSAATKAIAAINEDPWEANKYPNAIFDQEQQRWTSDAETGEIEYTAFSSTPKADHALPL